MFQLYCDAMSRQSKPAWAGDDFLARCVNRLIQMKPLYAVMKQQARQVLIQTAEKHGIPWRKCYEDLAAAELQQQVNQIINNNICYPAYYQMPFHAYEEGNLCWEAAFEAEAATHAMSLRVWKDEPLTWQAAHSRLRSSFHQILAQHVTQPVQNILDSGCSVGLSTFALHRFYQSRQEAPVHTIGLDLSPYMLTVAQYRDTKGEIAQWLHANAEATGLPDCSFDLVTLQFVIHELPRQATIAILRETLRLLRPGGSLAIVDNNPQSPVIQTLPPVLFTLMKSTEPWSDDYYTFDVEAAMQSVGFAHITTIASDPRHRTVLGQKP